VQWDLEALEELCEVLDETVEKSQFLWNNQQVVHVMIPGHSEPWATIHTKKPAGIDLSLHGPKNRFALGRIADLAAERELVPGAKSDTVKFRFNTAEQINASELLEFLQEHYESTQTKD
jgi:hypothetical protein